MDLYPFPYEQLGQLYLSMFRASDGVISTHEPWNHSSHPSHWIINLPSHGFLQRQYMYLMALSSTTFLTSSGFSSHLVMHSGKHLSLHSFMRSWFTTNMDFCSFTRNRDCLYNHRWSFPGPAQLLALALQHCCI